MMDSSQRNDVVDTNKGNPPNRKWHDSNKSMLSTVFVFPQPITLFQIQFLNAIGDLLDLIPSLSPTKNSS